MRGLIIAAPRSGAGKTTVSIGLMRALSDRGVRVQPFKCGPDYIDPAFHAMAARRTSFNLDPWAMDAAAIGDIVHDACDGADLAIVEGVMGLYDGAGGAGCNGRGSTADLARLTGWPIILVLDVSGQAETAAAIALGMAQYGDVPIAGVILNRVAGERHRALIEPGLAQIGMPLLGAIGREERMQLAARHLGLVQAEELGDIEARIAALAAVVGEAVDLDRLAVAAGPMGLALVHKAGDASSATRLKPPGQRIALARDPAFSFVYPHLLRWWRQSGAEVVAFSPLADEAPAADADAVWLPGGYPELHAGQLASAYRFKSGLAQLAARGVPVHGECGGYMVLGAGLVDADGARHAMTGLLALESSFKTRRLHLGYRRARLVVPSALGAAGSVVLGHEFHYATTTTAGDEPLVDCVDARGRTIAETGSRRGSVSGTFFHMIDMACDSDG